jgi:hypothetical protein
LTAYLATHGITAKHHAARARALTDPDSGVPPSVFDAYLQLEDVSRGARYELWQFSEQDVRELLDQELAAMAAFTGL